MSYGIRPGGVIIDTTATPVVVDMRLFIGAHMSITPVGQETLICASDSPTDTTVLTTATPPSATAKVPDFFHVGDTQTRKVSRAFPFWVIRTLTGTGQVFISPASRVGGSDNDP